MASTSDNYSTTHKQYQMIINLVLFDMPLKPFEWSVVILNLCDFIPENTENR